jgi:metal-responsive CopG/Arc/MetJ family transcriptional regulator
MAIVNFSVPDDVKTAFDRTFKSQNKSAVIADLMRRAVAETQLKERRAKLFRELTAKRKGRPPVTSEKLRALRRAERS